MIDLKPTILIVDDMQVNLVLLSAILKDEYTIKVAKSSKKGLEIVSSGGVDLILLDVMMPGMDGYQLCTLIKQNKQTQDIPIIFVTGSNSLEAEEKGFELGAVDYIAKPFRATIVKSRVKTHINLHLRQRELETISKIMEQQKSELETILQTSRDGIAILDMETNFLFFNDAYLAMTGFTKEELLAKSCAGLSALEDLERAIKIIETVKEFGFVDNFEKTCIVKDGKRVIVNMAISLMPDKKRFLITTKNITEAKHIQRQINEYVKLIDENIITSSTDNDGTITSVSKAFCEVSEFSKDELIGANHRIIRHPDMPKELYEDMWQKITSDEVWEGEVKNKTKSCGFYWVHNTIYPIYDHSNQKIGYTAIRQDITDKKIIEEISITDGLTHIFNRRYFNETFPKVISGAKRNDELVCFLLMDIDHFKQYNDNYGHLAGDDVLIKFATCLKENLNRVDDMVFRLGGEEFGIVFKSETKEKAFEFANTIRAKIEAMKIPHHFSSAAEVVTASMGLSCIYPDESTTVDNMYKEADESLYKAKESGRNKVVYNE